MREATAKPIVGVGRLYEPLDGVDRPERRLGPGRRGASIDRDPFLPQKIAEGRTDEIRECTGSNVCIMKVDGFGHLGCIQNATAGEEAPSRLASRTVLDRIERGEGRAVVGAGPAGMECAVTLGRRGFEAVHLVEASDEIGGRMRWVRRPRRSAISGSSTTGA